MGLDIYFHKINRQINKYSEISEIINQSVEDLYFRKVYFLLDFFNYGDNLTNLEITENQITDFIHRCKYILNNRNTININLEEVFCSNMYFGIYNQGEEDENEDDFELIERICNDFSTLNIDWKTETLYMTCWW